MTTAPAVNLPESLRFSVVVPIFNEEAVLPTFHTRLRTSLQCFAGRWEVLYIDDGSSDTSLSILQGLAACESNVGVAALSRNFGKEAAITAGLRLARGNAVVLIDGDLQDSPELIPAMLEMWSQGADVVNMRRRSRAGETWFKKATARKFYRVMNALSDVPIPADVGDFRLLSRRAVDAVNQLPEYNRFAKGLFAWIGYTQVTLDYDRHARAAGHSKWPYRKLWNFALEGITGFSIAPLKFASYAGLLSAAGAFVYALVFLVKTLAVGESVKGFPTLIVTILLLGGLQLMATGILGEYLGRLFMESKGRPLYLLKAYQPASSFPAASFPASACPLSAVPELGAVAALDARATATPLYLHPATLQTQSAQSEGTVVTATEPESDTLRFKPHVKAEAA
ncbi:MAG: glycosyltransferase [Polaromonas sp. 39-63-203]|uniref:glycosyltransferase family 2 protein n=1 Tax=Polaromonas sp. TaxID=1869339 RepID=UPI000BC8D59F|nr:glycosyltransferase family 2 protein [Polaromonas sp.]OYY52501.1 MAG: glycosyltransferase [Polaromonas sp. 35-63-240]OYY99450.1 MAG: glycosyltransferase [Polaromonas sp. 28-63-22]OYZ83832.1 MAG: glycosyltransferase [Polaromonas sp. 24-62-144]OZA98399.1 MAG: glycosyltransferase [Polaromonas sp. 39-63-203]HQS32422.1 glycosyltransferase family 2 protein [Polaromonas sp.]